MAKEICFICARHCLVKRCYRNKTFRYKILYLFDRRYLFTLYHFLYNILYQRFCSCSKYFYRCLCKTKSALWTDFSQRQRRKLYSHSNPSTFEILWYPPIFFKGRHSARQWTHWIIFCHIKKGRTLSENIPFARRILPIRKRLYRIL